MSKYQWQVKPPIDKEFIDRFPEISPVILQLLVDRELSTQEKIDEFLHPDYSQDLHSPLLFTDMPKVLDLIFQAKENNDKVLIYGDYDADGVSGTAILWRAFKAIGLTPEVYLPDREKDGYGLNTKTVTEIASQGVKVIITVDCGISNVDEVKLANSLGVKVIITDHHHGQETLPPAEAIIHPNLDKNYPFNDLCGGGVAFKVATALLADKRSGLTPEEADKTSKWLLDLVAISTVADMVPLLGENRTLVKYGLIVLAKTKNIGLQALIKAASVDVLKLNAYTIGFQLAPRINSASRMGHANTAYRLLTSEDEEVATELALELNHSNQARQSLTDKLVSEGRTQAATQAVDTPAIIVWGENWNPGVIGLVASKLVQDYARPVLALSFDGERYVASGRSIRELNLIETLDELSEYFIKYGGHAGAAGFSIKKEKFEDFCTAFLKRAGEKLKGVSFIPTLIIDRSLTLPEIDWPLIEVLEQFDPYGERNYKPKFLLPKVKLASFEVIGQDSKHLRLVVEDQDIKRKIIAFGFGSIASELKLGDELDLVCELGFNQWNGNKEIQLSLIDWRKAENK